MWGPDANEKVERFVIFEGVRIEEFSVEAQECCVGQKGGCHRPQQSTVLENPSAFCLRVWAMENLCKHTNKGDYCYLIRGVSHPLWECWCVCTGRKQKIVRQYCRSSFQEVKDVFSVKINFPSNYDDTVTNFLYSSAGAKSLWLVG
jgi:hypothetical protein